MVQNNRFAVGTHVTKCSSVASYLIGTVYSVTVIMHFLVQSLMQEHPNYMQSERARETESRSFFAKFSYYRACNTAYEI